MDGKGRGSRLGRRAGALAVAVGALAAAAPAMAQQAPQDTAAVHVVRTGDTLWDLAGQYLGNPFHWPEIHRLNQQRIANPHLIFPADRVLIPGLGAGRLAVAQPDAVAAVRAPADEAPERTLFYRGPKVETGGPRFLAADDARVPVVDRGEVLGAALLAGEGEVRPVGRLAELLSPTVVAAGMPSTVRPYERAYLTVSTAVRVGDRLHLVREGRSIPGYGRVYVATGVARVEALDGAVATVQVETMYDAVAVGDLALPMPEYDVPAGARPQPYSGAEGTLLAFEVPQPVHSTQDMAFLSFGRADGVRAGDEFVAVLPAERRSWGERPEVVVARLQVVRVAERTASARVVEMEYPALEPGLIVRQVARMP